MLRSGDLYLADCFFNKLHPNIVFIVPENSKVSLKGGEVYIDGSITYLESYFRNIKDKYIDYIESENNGNGFIHLDASLMRGNLLFRLGKEKELKISIDKSEE